MILIRCFSFFSYCQSNRIEKLKMKHTKFWLFKLLLYSILLHWDSTCFDKQWDKNTNMKFCLQLKFEFIFTDDEIILGLPKFAKTLSSGMLRGFRLSKNIFRKSSHLKIAYLNKYWCYRKGKSLIYPLYDQKKTYIKKSVNLL